jgi:molybdopterin molybdotransferase
MKTLEEAYKIIQENAVKIGTEHVPLSLSVKRVMVNGAYAETDLPPYPAAAFEGYAFRKGDVKDKLVIIETVLAGRVPAKKIGAGKCSKLMIGAQMPEGADSLVKTNDTVLDEFGKLTVVDGAEADFIQQPGELTKKGDCLIPENTIIETRHVGILASVGMHTVEVYKQPLVTVFSSGTELAEPEDILLAGQLRNSNGPQLLAQMYDIGLNGLYGGIADNDPAIMEIELSRSIENFNGIIISGGVFMGEEDFVPSILKKMGFEICFTQLEIEPGKSVLFATKGKNFCFGLSANPVSASLQYHLLVKPYLLAIMGHIQPLQSKKFILEMDIAGQNPNADNFVPVQISEECTARPVPYLGPKDLYALGKTDGFLLIPKQTGILKKGEKGRVILL